MNFKKLFFVAVVVALIVFGVRYFKDTDQGAFHEYSKDRVQNMFDNLKSGQSADMQDAMGYWRVGHPEPASQDQLAKFESFLGRKGLSRQVRSYEYVSSELVDGDDVTNRYVLLRCRVDGHDLGVIVRHKTTIQWAD